MAEKKKRKGRRSYLADFRKDATGNYVYTGNVYEFDGEESERKKYIAGIGALCVSCAALATAQELLPGTKMNNTFYVLIPWLIQFLSAASVVWAFARLAYGGRKLREYVYEATVKKLPVRSLITMVFCFATVAAEIVFICINGFGERVAAAALRPSLSLINGIVSLILHLLVKREPRYRNNKQSPVKRTR